MGSPDKVSKGNKPTLIYTVDVGGNSISGEVRTLEEPILRPRAFSSLYPDSGFVLPKKFKKYCGLAAGISGSGKMSKSSRGFALDTLRTIAEQIETLRKEGYDVHVIAVGTAPFRDASNGDSFRKKIKKETGIDLRVLSEDEEARYAGAGVIAHMPSVSAIVFDTGGGSTEFALIEDGEILKTASLPLGTRRIQAAEDPLEFIREHLDRLPQDFIRPDLPLIASGGIFRALKGSFSSAHDCNLSACSEISTVPLHNIFQYSEGLRYIDMLAFQLGLSEDELSRLTGIDKERLQLITPATLLLGEIKDKFGSESAILTNATMRDGLRVELAESLDTPFEITPEIAAAATGRSPEDFATLEAA